MAQTSAFKKQFGIYIHVPFCPHICPYCDFTKTDKFSLPDVNMFMQKVCEQWDTLSPDFLNWSNKATLYFGGGTPSLLPASSIKKIVDKIKKSVTLIEFTIESNPYSNFKNNLKNYRELGCERITLGAQSLEEESLRFLGRKHKPSDVLNNIKSLKEMGYTQIQVDLIYGLPTHLPERDLKSEIQQCVDAGATGISAYHLTIEQRTEFKNVTGASEEIAARDYLTILKTCEELGIKQSESSNFSFYEPHHNKGYWTGNPYLGLGTGAHGLTPPSAENPYGKRYKVGKILREISPGNDDIKVLRDTQRLFALEWESPRNKEEYIAEVAFTLLRTREGIPLKWLKEHCGGYAISLLEKDLKLQRARCEGRIIFSQDAIYLKSEEHLLADAWGSHIVSLIS